MSLTGLLKIGHGPVWEWFAEHFPQTQRVSTHANRELRPGGTDAPCVVPSVPGADRGLAGTTVGYVLSAHLRADGIDATVATNAARLLDGALRRAPTRPSVIERLTVSRIGELQPWTRELPEDEWIELARLAGILARFEQFFRAGPVVWPYLAGPLRRFHGDLNELAIALVDGPTLTDVCTLSRCAVEDHMSIRDAAELHIGPTFADRPARGKASAAGRALAGRVRGTPCISSTSTGRRHHAGQDAAARDTAGKPQKSPENRPLIVREPQLPSRGGQRLRKRIWADGDVLGNRNVDDVVAFEQPLGVDDRESDDLALGVVAEYMPLGRLIARGCWLAIPDVQVENVPSTVIGGVVIASSIPVGLCGWRRRSRFVLMPR
jgi:hypothetical protein